MIRSIRYITLLVLLQFVTGISVLYAQSITSASGIVRDSVSGEPLSYVSVMFENSTIGAMTDDDGAFSLQNDKGLTRLVVSSLGYDNKVVNLKAGQKNDNLDILLSPTSFQIAEVEVRPTKERYSRKDNPAVELIKKVIEHKNDNRIEAKDEYQSEVYEKLSMSLDDFNPNLEKNKFLKKFKFIKNYLDTSEFNGKPILTISVRETISDQYYRKHPKAEKTITKAKRQQGIDKTLDDGGAITANLEEIFKGVNIFDNNINILLNRFVSPLSSTLAVSYYKYYIMDTVDVAGDKCVDLAFVPVNSQSYGFTGRLYITLDGNYAVKKFLLNTPANINLNWVDKLRIEQEFKRMPDSTWVLANENTYVNFYIVKGAQQLYAHQLRNFDKYQFDVQNADSIFGLLGPIHELPEATAQTDTFWIHNRHVPLKEKESALDDLLAQLRKVPAFNVIIKTAEILITGYIPTTADKDKSKFDFGPMNTTFSANHLEGFRMRVGGMTTANLNPHWFGSGYLAYGVNDRKLKYNAKLTYSVNKKKYHEGESPVNNISAIQEYDVYTPGQDFLFTSKDNMFVAWKVGEPVTMMQYIRKTMLQYQKEWLNGLTLTTWARNENNEAAGGEDVAQVGHLMVDLVEELNGQIIAQLPGDGGQMDGGVGGAADGAVDDDGVLERRGGHDLAGGDVLLHQLHDLPAGIAGVLDDVPHGGGSQSRAGQRHAQSLGDALHGGCGAQEGARAHRGAAGQLIIPHFLRGDGVLALLTQGDVAGHQGRGHVGAGPHGAAGHEDGGDVHPGRSLQVGGNGLVAAGHQDHAVPGHCGGVNFHHVGQRFTGSQHHVHAVMALGAAVADVRGIVLGRLAALFVHAVHRLLHQLVQVPAAGVRVAVHALHHDLRLFNVRVVPARAHFQGVELCPQHPIVMTFLHHLLFLLFP